MSEIRRIFLCASLIVVVACGGTAHGTDIISSADEVTSTQSMEDIINEYVAIGLTDNLALQGQMHAVHAAQAALDAARAAYLPELSVDARYTVNHGGRTLSLPLGDALNPAYDSLTELMAAQGQSASFPHVDNIQFSLLRPQEQDTHLSLRQPIYAPAIQAQKLTQQALVEINEQQRSTLMRSLRRDITQGYLNWLTARNARGIVDSAKEVLVDNVRITQALYQHGKITQDQPLRANAELLAIEQQLEAANNNVRQSQRYLNFLLNRKLDTPLALPTESTLRESTQVDLAPIDPAIALEQAQAGRSELKQLAAATQVAEHQAQAARALSRPTLALGVDWGIQGDDYRLNAQQRYTSASLLLTWKFFGGGGLRARADAADALLRQAVAQYQSASAEVVLQVQQAFDAYQTAFATMRTAEARRTAARASFDIAVHKRDAGVISQTEFLDASSALTNAELNLVTVRYAVFARYTDLQYVSASVTHASTPSVP